MTTTREATCAERIGAELEEREVQLRDLFAKMDKGSDQEAEEAFDEMNDMDYGVSSFTTYRVIWSGGGPADFIDITTDEDGDITRVEYVYQDWFDGARQEVREGSAVWRYAEMILERRNA